MRFAITVFMIMIIIFSCTKKEEPKNIIARVDDRIITLEEFRLFYELDPNFGIDSTGYPALVDALNKFMDQIIACKKARREGLLNDPAIKRAIEWEKRQAMLRRFYREKIGSQIEISDTELHEAYRDYNSEVHVRHLFTNDYAQALDWYKQLKSGSTTFEALAQQAFSDTILARNGGDLGWIKSGELDADFADGVRILSENEISAPVKTKWGYHVIQLINHKKKVVISESEFNRQKRMLAKKIRRKKGMDLSREYIESYIGNLNPQPVAAQFMKLWQAAAPPMESERLQFQQKVSFTNLLVEQVENQLSSERALPLIKYKGGAVTLGEYLEALKEMPLSNRPRFKTTRELSDQIGVWIRDELLMEEARESDLAGHPDVQAEVRRFTEEQIYYYYINALVDDIETPDDVQTFFREKDLTKIRKYPELKHFNTLQEWQWWKAEKQLRKSLRTQSAEKHINTEMLKQENERINWDRRIRMFMIRKPS